MMQIGKKSEFVLCQVCPQDDKQTTFKNACFLNEVRIDQGSPESQTPPLSVNVTAGTDDERS